MTRLLIVEDDIDHVILFQDLLDEGGGADFTVDSAPTLARALAILAQAPYDLILTDLTLPDSRGIETVTALLQVAGEAPIVVLSADSDQERALEAVRHGADDYLVKGHFRPYDLARVIRYAIERRRAVAAQHQAQLDLQRSEERLRSIVNELQEGLIVQDAAGLIASVNPSAEIILGRSADQLIGHGTSDTMWQIKHEDGTPFLVDEMPSRVTLRTGRPQRNVVMGVQRPDGTTAWLMVNSHSVIQPGEVEPHLVFTSFFDITERKQIEVERLAKEAAEEANRAKSHFISRMSHELRTPLNAILGFAQLMAMGDLPPEEQESVKHVMSAGRHLLGLINEVLDIAQVESGQMSLSMEAVRADEVLHECLDLIASTAAQRRLHVHIESAGLHERPVLADRQRLKQVLLNLLSNAVKYNRPGGNIFVRYTAMPPDQLRLLISDTGEGIAAEDLPRLFSPFERLTADRSLVEGTGLGLAITKQLVMAMGGQVGVESTPGSGSTFWIQLPTAGGITVPPEAASQDSTLDTEAGAVTQRRTVLYIEDNPVSLALVERILQRRPQLRLLSAHTGLGLELVRQHTVDLILLDLHLPDLPGEEVLRRLRADSATHNIPVIIVSADASPATMARLLAAGANGYLTKPIEISRFLSLIDEYLAAPE